MYLECCQTFQINFMGKSFKKFGFWQKKSLKSDETRFQNALKRRSCAVFHLQLLGQKSHKFFMVVFLLSVLFAPTLSSWDFPLTIWSSSQPSMEPICTQPGSRSSNSCQPRYLDMRWSHMKLQKNIFTFGGPQFRILMSRTVSQDKSAQQ